MSNGKIKIDGKKLKQAIISSGYTQKEIDKYFGFNAGLKNYISRCEIPVSIKDSLEYVFGIRYEDYAEAEQENGCMCCSENNLSVLGWSYCPICGRDLR